MGQGGVGEHPDQAAQGLTLPRQQQVSVWTTPNPAPYFSWFLQECGETHSKPGQFKAHSAAFNNYETAEKSTESFTHTANNH